MKDSTKELCKCMVDLDVDAYCILVSAKCLFSFSLVSGNCAAKNLQKHKRLETCSVDEKLAEIFRDDLLRHLHSST